MESAIFPVLIIALASAGFILSGFIRVKKTKKHPMVCPIGKTCDDVINSKYATVFGVPVELLGMLYYGAIAVLYTALLLNPTFMAHPLVSAVFIATVGAFLFSLYSIFLQAFILKKWCMWCIASAMLSTAIFFCLLPLV